MSTTLRIPPRLPRLLSRRTFTTSPPRASAPFPSGPAPPRLPKDEQALFEKLQKQSTGPFSQPQPIDPPRPLHTRINQSPHSAAPAPAPAPAPHPQHPPSSPPPTPHPRATPAAPTIPQTQAQPREQDLHPHLRRGAAPEFEGEVNPRTGEVGGPKNEPLRWGAGADWSYNGRVTDF